MADTLLHQRGWRDTKRHDQRPLTGRTVLAIFLGFFATVIAANGIMIHCAISSFRGVVVDHPYEAGLAFNTDIAAARAQEARHWQVEVRMRPARAGQLVEVAARDAQGAPVTGLSVKGSFAAPVDARLDRRVDLVERTPGSYTGEAPIAAGRWDFELSARRGGETLFQSRNRVLVD